jgi:D-aminopeptidase
LRVVSILHRHCIHAFHLSLYNLKKMINSNASSKRLRARQLGIAPGTFPPGPLNALTDVPSVRVGHFTLLEGQDVRTGATAILPHPGNLFQDKVPAGLAVGNGYGKLTGSTQVIELGEIETPIVLTNTLAVPRAAEAILDWTLAQPGNESVASINPLVAETNDGWLNDIRQRALTVAMIRAAIETAQEGPFTEGSVGGGTGCSALGWKGGIGSSSRQLPESLGGFTLGVLVQANFGGVLQVLGVPVGQALGNDINKDVLAAPKADGSIVIVIAIDAPLSDRNLTRLARRALAGLARTGASMSNGSGDYVVAFSTDEAVRRTSDRRSQVTAYPELPNDKMSPFFQAAIEATEEAIYNALFTATSLDGYRGHRQEALPVETVQSLIHKSAR